MDDSLGDRMKKYEETTHLILPPNFPLIIRVDGHCFHKFTRGMEKPFDFQLIELMNTVGIALCKEISNTKVAYLQSDEINLLVYNQSPQEPWFGNVYAKLCSISASLAAAATMKWKYEHDFKPNYIVTFDSRAFILPPYEIQNYFIHRQNDWSRNSLQMLARSLYSHRHLAGKKKSELHELCFAKGQNWANLPTILKNGRCIIKREQTYEVKNEHFQGFISRPKWVVDLEIPVFTQDSNYLKQFCEDERLPSKSLGDKNGHNL